MSRKKVKLAWIVNETARKASLRKRKAGLKKKMTELTILCDVRACLIMYIPGESGPMVWPDPPLARGLIERFFALPEVERSKKAVNQETYLKERTEKTHEQLIKLKKKNKEAEMNRLMGLIQNGRRLDEFGLNEIHGLMWFTQERMRDCNKRIEFIEHVPPGDRLHQAHIPAQEAAATAQLVSGAEMRANNRPMVDLNQYLVNQWVVDNNNNNNNDNNSNNFNSEPLAAGNNPSGYHEFGQMYLGSPNYGDFRDIGLSYQYGDFLGAQGSANPNMNVGFLPPHPHMSYTNLILELSPYGHDINVHMGLNTDLVLQRHPSAIPHELGFMLHRVAGNLRRQPLGGREGSVIGTELGLGGEVQGGSGLMGTELGLGGGERGGGSELMGTHLELQPNGHGGGGGGSGKFLSGGGFGLQQQGGPAGGSVPNNQPQLPFGLFGGGTSGEGDVLPHDVSKTWPNDDSFPQ